MFQVVGHCQMLTPPPIFTIMSASHEKSPTETYLNSTQSSRSSSTFSFCVWVPVCATLACWQVSNATRSVLGLIQNGPCQVDQDRASSWHKPTRCPVRRPQVGSVRMSEGGAFPEELVPQGPVPLPLASDNQGNIYGLLNDYTRKMPTAGLLMEIMFQLTATSCSLMPSHVKRDFNQWADDLTHPSFEGFDTSLELLVEPLLTELKIFPWILQHLDAQGDLPGLEPVEPAAPAPKLKKRKKS